MLSASMEYFDIVDENGQPTGETVSRDIAHTDGILHRTAHVWVIRKRQDGVDVLLQKRSMEKDSFPGMYDTSSAGHIPAGDEPLQSAIRELQEELGISAREDQFTYMGRFRIRYEKEFHGRMFRDNEVSDVFVYQEPVIIEELTLQKTEVIEVRWFDLDEVWQEMQEEQSERTRFCIPSGGMEVLRRWLKL